MIHVEVLRRSRRLLGAVVVAVGAVTAGSGLRADVVSRAVTAGKAVIRPSGGQLNAPGAVATNAQTYNSNTKVGFGDPNGPAFSTSNVSDKVMIGPAGKQEPVINTMATELNGNREKDVIGVRPGGVNGGRKILYNYTENDDKIGATTLNTPYTMTQQSTALDTPVKATANATQTVRLLPAPPKPPIAIANGTATAQVQGTNLFHVGVAFAVVNDPIAIIPSALSPTQVTLYLGSDTDLLTYQAGDSNSFALGFFQLSITLPGGSQMDLLDLTIGVDGDTTSVDSAIDVLYVNPLSGFNNAGEVVNYLRPFFDFNLGTRTLTQNAQVQLFDLNVSDTSGTTTVTYNYEAIAGASVPEPSPLLLAFLGLGLAASWRWRRGGILVANRVVPYSKEF